MATTDNARAGAQRWRGLNRQEVVRAAGGDGASATAAMTRGGVARGGASAGTSDSAGSARASDDEEEDGKAAKGGAEAPSAPRTRTQRMADLLARAKATARAGIANVPRGSESKAKYGLKVTAEERENRKRQEEETRVKQTLLALQMSGVRSKPRGLMSAS